MSENGSVRGRAWRGLVLVLAFLTACGTLGDGEDPGETPQGAAVTSFSLVDADTNQPIEGFDPVQEGATFDLERLPTRNLNLRANTSPATVGSVVFTLNGERVRVENAAPYALFSHRGGDFYAWTPGPGAYRVTATPYSAADGRGTAGRALSLNFTVGTLDAPPTAPPPTGPPTQPPTEPPTQPPGGEPVVDCTPLALQTGAVTWSGEVAPVIDPLQSSLLLRVGGTSTGRSVQYIGANSAVFELERFNIRDVCDLGLTTYRYFGGTGEFEPVDADGRYGWPSVGEMKTALRADPSPARVAQFVNWSAFDLHMAPYGRMLQGLFTVPGMQPVTVLRNSSNRYGAWVPAAGASGPSCRAPDGSLVTWPEFTQEDWNEWWGHVFAVVYWINVRNGSTMRVDRWSVHNEPNEQPSQGWCGTPEQYLEFIKYTRDAIDFVYETFLGDRERWVYGGALSLRRGWEDWLRLLYRPSAARGYEPSMFDVIDIHPYRRLPVRVGEARRLTLEEGVPAYVRNYPIWTTEMGTIVPLHGQQNQWDVVPLVVEHLVGSFIGASTPGDGRVEGAILWRMYDGDSDSDGLIGRDGRRRAGFYALRLVVMGLNGGKEVFPTQLPAGVAAGEVTALTTREAPGAYNLLVTNLSAETAHSVQADVSALLSAGNAELYLFDASRRGPESLEPLSRFAFSGGRLDFTLPPQSFVLVRFRS